MSIISSDFKIVRSKKIIPIDSNNKGMSKISDIYNYLKETWEREERLKQLKEERIEKINKLNVKTR